MEGQCKPGNTGSVTFANLRSNDISLLCSKDFSRVRGVALAGEEGGGIGGKLPPSMLNRPDFKTNIGPL